MKKADSIMHRGGLCNQGGQFLFDKKFIWIYNE